MYNRHSILLLCLLITVGCSSPDKQAQVSSTDRTAPATADSTISLASLDAELYPFDRWEYDSTVDKMRGTSGRYASRYANNTLDFEFPYNGGSHPSIMLRNSPKHGKDIMIRVTKGQFSLPYNNEHIMVKFDDGPVERWAAAEAASGSSDVIFISNYGKFLSRLKTAKKVIIEANFYDAGAKQMEFDVEGLVWN